MRTHTDSSGRVGTVIRGGPKGSFAYYGKFLDRTEMLACESAGGKRSFNTIAVRILRAALDHPWMTDARCYCCDYKVVVELMNMRLLLYGAETGFLLNMRDCAPIAITDRGVEWLIKHEAPIYWE